MLPVIRQHTPIFQKHFGFRITVLICLTKDYAKLEFSVMEVLGYMLIDLRLIMATTARTALIRKMIFGVDVLVGIVCACTPDSVGPQRHPPSSELEAGFQPNLYRLASARFTLVNTYITTLTLPCPSTLERSPVRMRYTYQPVSLWH